MTWRWLRCPRCDVRWKGEPGELCWANCGVSGVPAPAVAVGSQHGFANAITERQWAEVRRQIGA